MRGESRAFSHMNFKNRMVVSLMAMLSILPGSSFAGKISEDLQARFAEASQVPVIVYFQDAEERLTEGTENQEDVIRRLQRNLDATRRLLGAERGLVESKTIRSENWLTNSISLTANRAMVERFEKNAAVKRII